PACLERRARALGCSESQTVTLEDAPVSVRYQSRLKKLGVHVQSVSKWCNAVSATLTPRQLKVISRLSFVRAIRPVGSAVELGVPPTPNSIAITIPPSSRDMTMSADSTCGYNPIIYHYGLAESQL